MKVLQINSVCGYGSTGRIATDIYNVLKENGHDCVIAYGRGNAPDDVKTIRIGSNIDNYMHVAKTRIFDRHGFGSKKATIEFIEKVKEYEPDVIHLHNIHGYYINIEILFNYLKQADKPVIWTLHDCWAFTGHCSYFDYISCERWKQGCYRCPQKSSYPKSLLIDNSKKSYLRKKHIFNGVDNMTFVTPSSWLSRLVKKSFLDKYKVNVIRNGIDLNIFKATESNFREEYKLKDKFIILGVANEWAKRKGYEYFLNLSEQINDDEVIVMVGVTEKQKKRLPENIIGITKTENIKELACIYSAADVFVNPTLEEVMGLVNVEALSCGTPVITFNTGGSVECVNSNCGVIVEKGNLDELVKAIKLVKEKGKASYSDKCIEYSYSIYNKQHRFSEYIDLYKGSLR